MDILYETGSLLNYAKENTIDSDNETKEDWNQIEPNYDIQKQYDLILFYFGQRELFLFYGYIRKMENQIEKIIPDDIYLLCYQYRLIFPYYTNRFERLSHVSLIPKHEPYIVQYYLLKINSLYRNHSLNRHDMDKWTLLHYHKLNARRTQQYEQEKHKGQYYGRYYISWNYSFSYLYRETLSCVQDEHLRQCIGCLHKFIHEANKLQNDINYFNDKELYQSFELTFDDIPETVLKHYFSETTYELFKDIAAFYMGKHFTEWMNLYQMYFSYRLSEIEQQHIYRFNIMKKNPILKDVYIERRIPIPTEISANELDIKLLRIQKRITDKCDVNGLHAINHFIEVLKHRLLIPERTQLNIFYEDEITNIKKKYLFHVPMQINKKNVNEGRIGIELFDDVCPILCYQFRLLTSRKFTQNMEANGNYAFRINSVKVEQYIEFCCACINKKQNHCLFPNGFQRYTDINEKGRQSEIALVLLNIKENINVFKSFIVTSCKFSKLISLNKSEYIIIGRVASGMHHLSYIESLKRYMNDTNFNDYRLKICEEGTSLRRN